MVAPSHPGGSAQGDTGSAVQPEGSRGPRGTWLGPLCAGLGAAMKLVERGV